MARRKAEPPPLEPGIHPWLLAAALVTAAPHAGHLPAWISALAGLLLLWRTWLWHGQLALPRAPLRFLLVAGGVGGIALEFGTLFGRDAGVALLALFMAMKPMEARNRRDALVIVMLGYFLLLTHYFHSESIVTGLWLLGAATFLTATLIRLHGGARAPREIAREAALIVLQALPVMLILFLLFPRVAGPLWGLPQDAHAGRTGLSDNMAPGSLSELIQSGSIAFRVQFSGTIPPMAERYWRGPVLTDYDGRTWRTGSSTVPAGSAPRIVAEGRHIDYVSTLEGHNQRWLLALDLPLALPPDSTLSPRLETLAREPVRKRGRYAFTSSTTFRANLEESPALLAEALRLPPALNPRTRALAEGWRDLPPERIAKSALAHFRGEPFYYTLRPPLLGQHAMDEFLFRTRRGFCEHYASAFVFLMRAAGVPARVVAGYQGGELNPVDGFLIVRQSDAHAWAEIWLDGRGWVRVDPTAAVAPSRIEEGIAAALPEGEPLPIFARIDAGWLRQMRHRWEAVNNAWNQWVLGYNPQRQQEFLSRLGLHDADWRSMTVTLTLLCAAVMLLLTGWVLYRRPRVDPVQRAWLRLCRRLAGQGVARHPWEGPADLAARVARESPEWGALAAEAARCYTALRYGHLEGAARTEQLRRLQTLARRLPIRWRMP